MPLAMFLDESGDHSLETIDPQYPIFVLGGCIMDAEYHDTKAASVLSKYKKELFGGDGFILHTADIVRRRDVFRKLTDETFRNSFYEKTNFLMGDLDYKVVACAIKKDAHLRRYGIAAIDPYMLSLRILVERFVYEIQSSQHDEGIIIAGARDEVLNNQLRLAWMDIRTSGTEYISAAEVRRKVRDLNIREKKSNIAELQIADLIVSPIGRRIIGEDPRQDWAVISSKFRRSNDGRYLGFGLVVLPRKKRRPNDSVTV